MEGLGAASYLSGAAIGAAPGVAPSRPRAAWLVAAAALLAAAPFGRVSFGAGILICTYAFSAGRWEEAERASPVSWLWSGRAS